jgi:dihydroneopterin aldolase
MQDLWDARRDHVRVMLRDVQTEARVGLHPWERHEERPSRLIVNVEMFAGLPETAGGAGDFIDYDGVRAALKAWPARPHTDLLETLAEEVIGLCFANPRVEACRVSVTKPDIFNEAAAAGVEIYRVRPPCGGC